MSAIYRRARPATFAQVIGQDHVKSVLVASLERDRIGHAYLFSGPRGVGKTTTARLLAMAVNCESPGDNPPCGACESCTLIRKGSHPDVTELDAASNNSVEDIRDLREKVRLASLRGGHRVWILDEAHMLSRSAGNALLKTLEEPPPRLIFVLATTEPEKLPPTILSRCQHFRFRRLSEDEIAGKLARLCREAGVEAEPDALALVARAADGAMRDAESLLERLLASGEPIVRSQAEDALGLPPRERLEALATALCADALDEVLTSASDLYRDGFSPRSLAEQLTRTLRDALYRRVTGDDGFTVGVDRDDLLRLLHALDDEHERFVRHDDLFALEAAMIKARNALFRNVPDAATPPPRAADEVVAAGGDAPGRSAAPGATPAAAADVAGAARDRSGDALPAFDPHARSGPRARGEPSPQGRDASGPDASAAATEGAGARDEPRAAADGARPAPTADAEDVAEGSDPTRPSGERRRGEPTGAPPTFAWREVKSRASAQLKAFLMPAEEGVAGDTLTLRYSDTHRFHFNELKKRASELVELVAEVGGSGCTVVVEGPGDTLRKKS